MKIEGVGRLKDYAKKRYVLCHNIVSSFFVNNIEKHPLDHRIYLKKEVAKNLKKTFKTKIVLAHELISEAYNELYIDFVVFDAWYFANKLVKYFKELGLDWITRAKSNRLVHYKNEWRSLDALSNKIPRVCYKKIWIKTKEGIEYYYIQVMQNTSVFYCYYNSFLVFLFVP